MAARRALLVLDNLEQMHGADAAVANLLRAAPELVVLATSRRPLHLTSEHQYAVPPLAAPGRGHARRRPRRRRRCSCSSSEPERCAPSFALTADNSADVVAICRHLDGLPLAIELAAARTKLLGPRALLARLDQALDLRGSDADRPTVSRPCGTPSTGPTACSPAPQQALFRRLGVFAGGADLDAVAAVCADDAVGTRPG